MRSRITPLLALTAASCSTAQRLADEFVTPVDERVTTIRADVDGHSADIRAMQVRLDALEAENAGLRSDVDGLRSDLDALDTELVVEVADRLAGEAALSNRLGGDDAYELTWLQSDTAVTFRVEKGVFYGIYALRYPLSEPMSLQVLGYIRGHTDYLEPTGLRIAGLACDADPAQRGTWDLANASCVEVEDGTWDVTMFADGEPIFVGIERLTGVVE